jgi:hypothetical protein
MQGVGYADDLLYFKCPTTKQMRCTVNAYLEFDGVMPRSGPHETESAMGGPPDRWLLEKKVANTEKTEPKEAFYAHP